MNHEPKPVTTLLAGWRGGDKQAADELITTVYQELRQLAAGYMRRERPGHTLQPTALVNELFLKLLDREPVDWQSRAHFFAVAAGQLRRILVNHARERHADKRGGGQVRVALTDMNDLPEHPEHDLLEVSEALDRLEEVDERAARVIELRFFGGLTDAEAAEALGTSVATLKRDWAFGRAWLLRHLRS